MISLVFDWLIHSDGTFLFYSNLFMEQVCSEFMKSCDYMQPPPPRYLELIDLDASIRHFFTSPRHGQNISWRAGKNTALLDTIKDNVQGFDPSPELYELAHSSEK